MIKGLERGKNIYKKEKKYWIDLAKEKKSEKKHEIVFRNLKSWHIEDVAELFKTVPEDRTRNNRFKIKYNSVEFQETAVQ